MRLNHNRQDGFTLIEVTIILLVLVILSTIMLPQLGNFNRLAHFVKAKEDLTSICASAKKMLDEVMLGAFYKDPNGEDHEKGPEFPIGLLVGPGAVPKAGTVDAQSMGVLGRGWLTKAGDIPKMNCFTAMADDNQPVNIQVTFGCDYLFNHLQRNDPMGPWIGTRYKNAFEDVDPNGNHPGLHNALVGGIFGWRGPYFDNLTPDPWGNRYMINSFGLYADPRSDGNGIFSTAVVCYSTGPDLGTDTVFNQPQNPLTGDTGWETGGDDLAVILSSYGPF